MAVDERLVGISLGGFQVFEELTEIPFGHITLLYGPNSAGKSAVEDALILLRDVWCRDDNDKDEDGEQRQQLLKRHWRHIDEEGSRVFPKVVLGAKFVVPISKLVHQIKSYPTAKIFRQLPDGADDCIQLELRLTYITVYMDEPTTEIEPGSILRRNIEILLDGWSLISFEEHSCCVINLSHPLFSPWHIRFLKSVEIPTKQGKFFRSSIADGEWKIWSRQLCLTREHFVDLERILAYTKAPKSDVRECLAVFKELFDSVISACKSIAKNALGLVVVPASRKIPSPTDLLHFFMGPNKGFHWNEQLNFGPGPIEAYDTTVADLQESYGIRDVGDPMYRELAKSMACGLLVVDGDNGQDMEGQERSQEIDDRERRLRSIGEQVNKMLAGHLFIDRGYRLAAEYRFLLSKKNYDEVARGHPIDIFVVNNYPMLLRLFLVDAKGRQFNFDQVGSGLGYVLPVLAVLFSSSSGVLVQQPELHLHPALQAELGDVFIEAHHGNSGPIIIETHSEHLLLRILKRVRQTHQRKQFDTTLQVQSSDIAVLYFDPMRSGVTQVKQLRISDEGEFMDRWPKGFFAERDQELFDE